MTALAFLLTDRLDAELTAPRLLAQLTADWGPEVAGFEADPEAEPGGPLALTRGDQVIVLMGIDAPTGDDLADLAAGSRLWPRDVPVPDHHAHVIVTVLTHRDDEPTHLEAQADMVLLSRVLASAIAVSDVQAVYLGAAHHLVLPAAFRDLAVAILPDPLVHAWIAVNVGADPNGRMTGFTRGLGALGAMDIEIPETPESAEDTYERLFDTALYLMEQGPVIGDGDTLGATEAAEVVARHRPSLIDPEETVLRLTFVGPQRKRGLFGWRR